MAFNFAHGAIQWSSADAATTTYPVSGLGFAPKAIRLYWQGLSSATDTSSTTAHYNRGVGFATSTSDRKCVVARDQDAAGSMTTIADYRNDACVAVLTAAALDGALDVSSFDGDGFTLVVDDQVSVSITVFYEAWGGSDITVQTTGVIDEPAATGDVDYTVTGFVAGNNGDQVVMFAGCQATAANTPTVADSGLYIGAASAGTTSENIVMVDNNDEGSANSDTDSYAIGGECLAMIAVAGGNPNARATLTQFGTDNFRLNWIARGVTNRKTIFLAIKGGQWRVGDLTIDTTTTNATSTVSGLPFAPVGLSVMTKSDAEDTAGASTAHGLCFLGTGSSTSSRRAMSCWCVDGAGSADVRLWIEYDQVLRGNNTLLIDINAMNSDGFQLIVDANDAAEPNNAWIGYLTFGAAAVAGTATLIQRRRMLLGVGA